MMSEFQVFPQADQDKNANNTGDKIKVVIDDAVGVLANRVSSLVLIDTHAGAGCYPIVGEKAGPTLEEESYYVDMQAALARSGMSRLRLERERVQSSPQYLGLGPMLLLRHPKIQRYLGFELNSQAAERLLATLEALEIERERFEVNVGGMKDGWLGAEKHIELAQEDPLALVVDPMNFQKDHELDSVQKLVELAVKRTAPTVLAIFNPGTQSQNRGAPLRWDVAEERILSAAGSWDSRVFTMRKFAGGEGGHAGRSWHYGIILLSNQADILVEVDAVWKRRRERSDFAHWTDVRLSF